MAAIDSESGPTAQVCRDRLSSEPDFTPMIREYFAALVELQQKYGHNIMFLYQVGSFYECYSYEHDKVTIGNAKLGAHVLNILFSRKNKKLPVSSTNPAFFGFQMESWPRMVQKLLDAGFIVPMYNQRGDERTKRELFRVYTPGAFVDGEIDNHVGICSICRWDTYNSYGCVHIDTFTGNVRFVQIYIGKDNSIDSILEFINLTLPRELLVFGEVPLHIQGFPITHKHIPTPDFFKLDYQQELIGKVYPAGLLSPIENLSLECYPAVTLSLSLLLQYIYENDERVLLHLHPPVCIDRATHLHLINDTADQLDVYNYIRPNFLQRNSIPDHHITLFNILDFTATAMGARMLKDELLAPCIHPAELTARYDTVEHLIPQCKAVANTLADVYDLARLFRRLETNIIHPYELAIIYHSLDAVNNSFRVADMTVPPGIDIIRREITDRFDIAALSDNIKVTDVSARIFTKDKFPDVERIRDVNALILHNLNDAAKLLSQSYIGPRSKTAIASPVFDLAAGSYIKIMQKRWDSIPEDIQHNFRVIDRRAGYLKLSRDDFSQHDRQNHSMLLHLYHRLLVELNNFDHADIIRQVARLDFLNSLAIAAVEYKYTRPTLSADDQLHFVALRHPIVERVHDSEKYVPNDLDLGYLLLYGTNACGKSVLLKAVGLAVIMAQIGSFVASDSMTFSPRHKLITRITYKDNLHKDLSSFLVEMVELKYIIQHTDQHSLVLGDEICKGTENISATSIVAAAILYLADKHIPFFFTSHLHSVADLLNGSEVQIKHLAADISPNAVVTYHRTLQNGPGPNMYGIEVCRGLQFGDTFINHCFTFRNHLVGKRDLLVPDKRSRYNTRLIVDKCSLCGKQSSLETHHIDEQHTADSDGFIGNYHKNTKFNLVILCDDCHTQLHHTNGVIKKRVTSRGVQVDLRSTVITPSGARSEGPNTASGIVVNTTKKL